MGKEMDVFLGFILLKESFDTDENLYAEMSSFHIHAGRYRLPHISKEIILISSPVVMNSP